MFSQVREDPNVEISLHNRLLSKNKRYLIVGSGGCTIFSLLSQIDDNTIIDVIDVNVSQLYLIQLKLETICYFNNIDKILDLWEGECKLNLDGLTLSNECKNYFTNDLLNSGINQNGIFEKLFKELVDSNFDYEKVFDRKYLEEKFGIDSVINSLNHEFYDHFKNILNSYDNDLSNYFYYQILYNKYNRNYLPSYFNNLTNIIKNKDKINYINENIYDYIGNNKIKYDLIHTSNITDWMNVNKCNTFVENIYNLLNTEGIVVMRRLNGDYELNKLLDKFKILNIPHDKSNFYNEVIAGQKTQLC